MNLLLLVSSLTSLPLTRLSAATSTNCTLLYTLAIAFIADLQSQADITLYSEYIIPSSCVTLFNVLRFRTERIFVLHSILKFH